MKKTVLVAITLLTVFCVVPAWCQGQSGPGGPGGPGGGMISCPAMAIAPPSAAMVDRLAENLSLTEDQTTKLKAVMTKSENTITPLSKKLTEATKALRSALTASTFDADNVKVLAAAAEKAEAAVVSARIDEWIQMRSILTAEQVTKLQATANKRPSGMGRNQMGPPPGDSEGNPPPPMSENE